MSDNPLTSTEAVLGAIFNLMASVPGYAGRPLKDLHQNLLPPVATQQFRIVRDDQGQAVAFASWALVSPEIRQKLTETGELLKPSEWQSGDIAVLVDLAATNPKLGQSLVARIKSELFPDKTLMARRGDASGKKLRWIEVPARKNGR